MSVGLDIPSTDFHTNQAKMAQRTQTFLSQHVKLYETVNAFSGHWKARFEVSA